jgi:predicted molibdopterin-dependent oxidoreductase YjgC
MKIRIDNIEVEAEQGQTILESSVRAGIVIPTLCHSDGVEHYSSCMVCLVKDKKTGNFIPSCSALVQDGMDIDASGEEIINIRKKAVMLLLSEHRAECEALCTTVCPAGYNIPLMNRLLKAGKFEDAAELCHAETGGNELHCFNCKAYCENACRRKKIDNPVSIRNIKIFICRSIPDKGKKRFSQFSSAADSQKKFSSRIGRLEEREQLEWLKECGEQVSRFREIDSLSSAASEAGSCMHCDCRASENCRLRDLADKFDLKDPKGKVSGAPISKKISHKTGLIFEYAKCIKCGLCVRISGDKKDGPSLCFINRGFVSGISEPLTEDFENIMAESADLCAGICPTGALGHYDYIKGK